MEESSSNSFKQKQTQCINFYKKYKKYVFDKSYYKVENNEYNPSKNVQNQITIVEFAGYQCPFCAQFHRETMHSIKKNFIDTEKVKFLFKDLVNDRQYDKASTLAAST